MSPTIYILPVLTDNYCYFLQCPQTGELGIVDPGETLPVLQKINDLGGKLAAIFATHHHPDHIGAIPELIQSFPHIKIYGHISDRGRIPHQNQFVAEGDMIKMGNLRAHLIHNPGHTSGAITYDFSGHLFTGDTLFGAGCGRIFEGTAKEMRASLHKILDGQAPKNKIYFGHEYTEKNLAFANQCFPQDAHIQNRMEKVRIQRQRGEFTTPSNVETERQTNPFLRPDNDAAFAEMRQAKDIF